MSYPRTAVIQHDRLYDQHLLVWFGLFDGMNPWNGSHFELGQDKIFPVPPVDSHRVSGLTLLRDGDPHHQTQDRTEQQSANALMFSAVCWFRQVAIAEREFELF